MLTMSRGVLTVAIGLLLTGCAGGPVASPPSSIPSAPTPVPIPSTVPVTKAPSAAVAIEVHKTGGFAGVDEKITVDPQGNWTKAGFNATKPSGKLTADQVAKLQTLAADPRIAQEAKVVRGPSNCNDTFQYRVTVGSAVVAFDDCPSADQPKATMALLAYLGEVTP